VIVIAKLEVVFGALSLLDILNIIGEDEESGEYLGK